MSDRFPVAHLAPIRSFLPRSRRRRGIVAVRVNRGPSLLSCSDAITSAVIADAAARRERDEARQRQSAKAAAQRCETRRESRSWRSGARRAGR